MNTNENCSTTLTCYDDYFILSRDPLYRGSVRTEKQVIMSENRNTEYNGFMSPATKRNVRSILTAWVKCFESEHNGYSREKTFKQRKLTFVTLTLSQKQVHTDNEVKRKMLNRFLIKVQRSFNVKYYFWRAEKQKNGNIHFHLILDAFIDKKEIQTQWNLIQADFNYLDDYFSKHNHYKAPSTDVGIISSMKDSVSYVMKYVTKNPDDLKNKNLKVSGRIWSCSKQLKSLKPYSVSEDKPLISRLYHESNEGRIEALEGDFFTIFRCNTREFLQNHFIRKLYVVNAYYSEIFRQLYLNPKTKVIVVDAEPEISLKIEPAYYQGTIDLFDNSVISEVNHHY